MDSALKLAGCLSSFQLKVSIASLTGPGCVRDSASEWNQANVVRGQVSVYMGGSTLRVFHAWKDMKESLRKDIAEHPTSIHSHIHTHRELTIGRD